MELLLSASATAIAPSSCMLWSIAIVSACMLNTHMIDKLEMSIERREVLVLRSWARMRAPSTPMLVAPEAMCASKMNARFKIYSLVVDHFYVFFIIYFLYIVPHKFATRSHMMQSHDFIRITIALSTTYPAV